MRAAELLRRLDQRGALLLDGGLGTLLMAAGLEPGRAPEWWVLERPDAVREAHRAYVEAGSEVIHACCFGGSPVKLEAAGLAGRCREVNARAVQLAREAAAGRALVAGDVGPTGRFLPPLGDATPELLAAAYREQVEVLAGEGVDLISIETMIDLREAQLALAAALATGLPVLCALTFEARPRGVFTIMGDRLEPSLAALAAAGAHAVGCNCSVTSEPMLKMVQAARPGLTAPIVAQPNAGQPRVTPEGIVYDADPEAFAADLLRMVEEGARLVGGCCGTTPAFIAAARARLDGRACVLR